MCLNAGWARTRSRPRLDLKANPPRSQSPRSRPPGALSRVCSCLRKRLCAAGLRLCGFPRPRTGSTAPPSKPPARPRSKPSPSSTSSSPGWGCSPARRSAAALPTRLLPRVGEDQLGMHQVIGFHEMGVEAELAANAQHALVLRQDHGGETVQPLVAADGDELAEQLGSQPAPLERVADQEGEFGLVPVV